MTGGPSNSSPVELFNVRWALLLLEGSTNNRPIAGERFTIVWVVFVVDSNGNRQQINQQPYNSFQVMELLETLDIPESFSLALHRL